MFPVSSGLFFSKSYFMHMLRQWQNLALSVCKVYREKKRMHLLDPKAEPHTGGMTFLGRGRAKSSPQLPWSLAHAALARLSEEAAGRALSWGEDSLLWSKRGQIQPPLWQSAMHLSDHPATESWNRGRSVKINRVWGGNFQVFLHLLVEFLIMLLELNYNSMSIWYLYYKLCQGYFKMRR